MKQRQPPHRARSCWVSQAQPSLRPVFDDIFIIANMTKLLFILVLAGVILAAFIRILADGGVLGEIYMGVFVIIVAQWITFFVLMLHDEITSFCVVIVLVSWVLFIVAVCILYYANSSLSFIMAFMISYLILMVFPIVSAYLFYNNLENKKQ